MTPPRMERMTTIDFHGVGNVKRNVGFNGTPNMGPVNPTSSNSLSIPPNGNRMGLTPLAASNNGTPIDEAVSTQNMLSRGYQPANFDNRPKISVEYKPTPIPNVNSSSNIWVDEHNRIRRDVGQPPVGWSANLANSATGYAEVLADVEGCQLIHDSVRNRTYGYASEGKPYGDIVSGENLAFGSPASSYDEEKIMGLWEGEKQYFKPVDKPNDRTGHYTQIVNKNVKDIGCGCAGCQGKSAKGAMGKVCVCRYDRVQSGNQPPY